MGVVLEDQNFIVFYDLKSMAFSMVDTAHKKFPTPTSSVKDSIKVRWTKNCEGSDFRLMDYIDQGSNQSYFVVYPAPENRKLDLFGFYGRRNNASTHFISDKLFLAKFNYRDVF